MNMYDGPRRPPRIRTRLMQIKPDEHVTEVALNDLTGIRINHQNGELDTDYIVESAVVENGWIVVTARPATEEDT